MTQKTKKFWKGFIRWFFYLLGLNILNTATWWIMITNFLIGRNSYLVQKANGEVVKKVESLFWEYDWSEKGLLILFAVLGALVSLFFIKIVMEYKAKTKEKKVVSTTKDETAERLLNYIEKTEKIRSINSANSIKKIDNITEDLENGK